MMYIYPDNLKAKPTLWLWELKSIAVIGIGAIISVFALVQTSILFPLAITGGYAFLTIGFDGVSILSFIKNAVSFFILGQQTFEWKI